MAAADRKYLHLLSCVMSHGFNTPSRVGGVRKQFGLSIAFDHVEEEFPLLTVRQLFPRGMLGELAAFIEGTDRLADFKLLGCNYWDQNAAAWPPNAGLPPEQQRVGKIYGYKWRHWAGHYDQLKALVNSLRADPFGRRHLLTTYDPIETDACLPPCHLLAQFCVEPVGQKQLLDCVVYMRSVDLVLGLPSDVVVYAMLLRLVAAEVGMNAGTLHFMFGDAHIYENHFGVVTDMLSDTTKHVAPQVDSSHANLFQFNPDTVIIKEYRHGPRYALSLNV